MAGILNFCSRSLSRNVLKAAAESPKRPPCNQNSCTTRAYHRTALLTTANNSALNLSSHRFSLEPKCQTLLFINRCIQSSSVLCAETKDVVVPAFADSVSEGDVKWEKNVGDTVAVDETVCEIETDKTSIPVPAPGNGVIEELYVEDGGTVKAGQKLFRIKLS